MTKKQTSFFNSPTFWIAWFIISASSAYFSYLYFPKAVPLLNIEITMDRDEALKDTQRLSQQFGWGPKDYYQAADFETDQETKHFVELEGGGIEKLTAIMDQDLYSPYTWRVRHFQEDNVHETMITFKPDGTPYGFNEKLPENMKGAALSKEQARSLAEKIAGESWFINFKQYELVEHAQKTRTSDRVDHTFTYERTDQTVNGAPYRLKLKVSGDVFSKLKHSIKVPDGFKRRYEHMRSANNAIAKTASILFMLLYVILGSIVGLFVLVPRGWIIWQQALYWAAFISGLGLLDNFNNWPLYWMYYNTAYSITGYSLQLVVMFIQHFVMDFALLAISFTAAETLTRTAFGNKLQLWKLWSKDVVNSWQTLGRTVAGYLILGTDFAYVTIFYFVMLKYMGWWSPADSLYNPDVLATYVPWFSSIAQSLHAGFWEECIFRAVPLACAALLGKRYGKKNWWIAVAFILQAVIFGAAHANYPAQPAYARLVELIIPSFIFGALYLGFGLLPAIISHVVYDIVWFALPLFVSHAPGIMFHKIMVILCALFPLLLVITSRFWYGSWTNAASSFLNKNFKPKKEQNVEYKPDPITHKPFPSNTKYLFRAIIASLIIMGSTYLYHNTYKLAVYNSIPIATNRTDAIAQTNNYFTKLDSTQWTPLTTIQESIDVKHRFIWQTQGKERYQELLNSYLIPAHFKTRLVQFEGDIAERQEEYNLLTNGDRIIRAHHIYAEEQKSESLHEEEARKLAYTTIQDHYNLSRNDLKEISAVPSKKPHRNDWTFTFQNTTQNLGDGQARIIIGIAGNIVNDLYRDVFVPEQWKRNDQFNQMMYGIISSVSGLILFIILLCMALWLFNINLLRMFNWHIAAFFTTALSLKTIFQIYNNWPTFIGNFKTSEPYSTQVFSMLIGILLYSFLLAGFVGYTAGIIHALRPRNLYSNPLWKKILFGSIIGSFIFFIYQFTLLQSYTTSYSPSWPTYSYINGLFPEINMALAMITSYSITTLFFLFFAGALDNLYQTQKEKYGSTTLLLLACICFIGSQMTISSLYMLILYGIGLGIIARDSYAYVFKYDRSIIPLAIGTFYCLQALNEACSNAWNGVWLGALITIALITTFSIWWAKKIKEYLSSLKV